MIYEITLDKSKLNAYKLGRISGMIHILTGQPEKGFPHKHYRSRNVCQIAFETDADGMFKIQDAINKQYPGVIIAEED